MMLNREDVAQLRRELQGEKVLSVYLNGEARDFSARKGWRTRMEHAVSIIRQSLGSASSAERDALDRAFQHIQSAVASFDFLPDRGWVGFALPDRLALGSSTRVPMPDLVSWDDGPRIAPYIRALKQERLVVAVLVDSRRARLFEYQDGSLLESDDFLADLFVGDLSDVNVSRRATSHSGVRGETGVDAEQRLNEVGAERLVKRTVEAAIGKVGTKGVLIVGGVPESIHAVMAHLPPALRKRTIERPSAILEMSLPDVTGMIEEAASELSRRIQEELLQDVIDQAKSGGKGALGQEAVEAALAAGKVDTLLLSRTFIQRDSELADRFVGAAFDSHSEIEELSADVASHLDSEGDGVAARLRYQG